MTLHQLIQDFLVAIDLLEYELTVPLKWQIQRTIDSHDELSAIFVDQLCHVALSRDYPSNLRAEALDTFAVIGLSRYVQRVFECVKVFIAEPDADLQFAAVASAQQVSSEYRFLLAYEFRQRYEFVSREAKSAIESYLEHYRV